MTNAPLDIQPALRARNVLVRGGRLTRLRGQVASIAPSVSVVATATALLIGSVEQAAAQADNACGGDNDNDGVIKCTAGNYADGITYTNTGPDGLTLLLDDPAGITVGGSGVRMDVPWGHEGDISVQIKTEVNVTTIGVSGVFANSTGNAHAAALMTEGSITTTGQAAGGLGARAIGGDGNATALMIEGNVKTSGDAGTGLWAGTNGGGDALARMDGGKITTVGERSAEGIHAWVGGTDSQTTATARMTAGDVSTRGAGSHGLFATNSSTGIGDTLARIDGGTVTTVGDHAAGLLAHIQHTDGKGTATARMTGEATVNTSGDEKPMGFGR